MKFTREITVIPAYDCIRVKPCVHGSEACSAQPGRSHGIHNAVMSLSLHTDAHEVALRVNTGWYLPQTPNNFDRSAERMGSSVGWHSREDMPETDARGMRDPEGCPRGWETCFADMAYLLSNEGALLLVTEGTDAVWGWLEEMYNDRFVKTGDTEDE